MHTFETDFSRVEQRFSQEHATPHCKECGELGLQGGGTEVVRNQQAKTVVLMTVEPKFVLLPS